MGVLADNLQAWLRGDDTIEAHAAGSTVASLVEVARQILIKPR